MACERAVLRACLSQVSASPSVEKGFAILGNLSRPYSMTGASLEALSLVRSILPPLVRARGAHCKTAAHDPRAKRMLRHWRGAFGEGRAPARPSARAAPVRQRLRARHSRNGRDARCPSGRRVRRPRPTARVSMSHVLPAHVSRLMSHVSAPVPASPAAGPARGQAKGNRLPLDISNVNV